jgi:hypothetical protein
MSWRPIPFCIPGPYSLFPIPYSLFPIPYSLFPIPYSLFPIPYSLFPIACQDGMTRRWPGRMRLRLPRRLAACTFLTVVS